MAGILCLSAVVTFAQAVPTTAPSATPNATPIDETKIAITDNTPNQVAGSNGAAFGVWDLVRMLVILGLVVAAIYGIFHIIQRGSRPKTSESSLINLLGSQGLPGNRQVHLISVQKQVFLIGGGDAGVSLIAEITDQESIDELKLQAAKEQPAQNARFADMLGGFFQGTGIKGGPVGGSTAGGLDFMKRQRDRLKKFKG